MGERTLVAIGKAIIGQIIVRLGGTGFLTFLGSMTAERSQTFQDATGTVALLEISQTFAAIGFTEQTVATTGSIPALSAATSATRLTGAAPVIQGITAPASGDAFRVYLCVTAVTFNHQDAGATAANRITTATGAAVAFTAGSVVFAIYDSTTLTWRIK